jgi:hypothetical protein
MTALSTMLGLLPMAIGAGEGGETQAPLARAVVGGLLSSTLITLVIIPVIYSFFEGGFKKLAGKLPAPKRNSKGRNPSVVPAKAGTQAVIHCAITFIINSLLDPAFAGTTDCWDPVSF